VKEIQLTQGKVAIVDDEDFEYLNRWTWHYCTGYAKRIIDINGKRKRIRMHRAVLDTPDGIETDHINRNKLDNRKENLRYCTRAENMRNVCTRGNNLSGYKGVGWNLGKWRSRITIDGKRICLGRFVNVKDAAQAYNKSAKEHYGEFAYLNKL
jgi:hypothetical protein